MCIASLFIALHLFVPALSGGVGTRPPVSLSTVQILPPGSGKLPAAVTVQQIQQLVKQQAQQGLPQIITSLPPGSGSTAVIASQILTTPSATRSTTIPQTVTVTAVPSATQVAVAPGSAAQAAPTVTLTPTPATLVKQVQEVVVSPNKTVGTPGSMATQLKAMQNVRQVGAVSVATHGHQVAGGTLRPSIAVQQAVQQVQAQAQAQAQQQLAQRFIAPTVGTTVVVSQSAAGGATVTAPATIVSATPVQPGVTTPGQDPKTAAAYTMRLRNPPKH